MAKNIVAQSHNDCIYVLKFSSQQWADFKKLLSTASCIIATLGADETRATRRRTKTPVNFFSLEKKLTESVFAKVKRISSKGRLLCFSEDDWDTFDRFLRVCCILADLLNPTPTYEKPSKQTVKRRLRLRNI